MARIAILITDLFEDIEYTSPASSFTKAGHKIVHVGPEKGKTVHGKKEDTPVQIDKGISECSADDFDALFIPGGYSPDKLRINKDVVEFAGKFMTEDKPVFVICHGPQLLITARTLEGRTVTGWQSIVQDIINAGAEYVDQEVVTDRNLVSSRSPADLPAFIEACLKKLQDV